MWFGLSRMSSSRALHSPSISFAEKRFLMEKICIWRALCNFKPATTVRILWNLSCSTFQFEGITLDWSPFIFLLHFLSSLLHQRHGGRKVAFHELSSPSHKTGVLPSYVCILIEQKRNVILNIKAGLPAPTWKLRCSHSRGTSFIVRARLRKNNTT